MKIGMISLGCPKNLTDTEVILGKLVSAGHQITNDESDADVLIVNTCAFIKPAIDEAKAEIKRAVALKRRGTIKYVIVAGCLPQRMKFDKCLSKKETSLVDCFIGSGGIDRINEYLKGISGSPDHRIPGYPKKKSCLFDWKTPRVKVTPKHCAYIKIADGCDNKCTYCSVPKIRGPYKSRKMPDIIKEAKLLAESGVRELIIIAQDTTYYGEDVYGKFKLPALLKKLCRIKGIKWVRLMYAHPAHFSDKLIKTIAEEKKIVKYLDLPIQHVCDRILRLMGRRTTGRKIVDLIGKIRSSVPGIALRTSLIVGFPGETKRNFNELVKFIQKERFERLGIFTYSRESGTSGALLRGQVPEQIKKSRYHQAMRLQNQICRQINERKMGKVISVLIDRIENGRLIGRSPSDAPEIDGSVIISLPRLAGGRKKNLLPGEIVKVRVSKASAYDLFGSLVT
jgi:ribosomal protein S12 methylthiotransferase